MSPRTSPSTSGNSAINVIDGLPLPDHDDRLHHGAAAAEDVGEALQFHHLLQGRQGLLVALVAPGIGHGDDGQGAALAGGHRGVQQLLQIVLGLGRIGGQQHGQQRSAQLGPALFAAQFLVEEAVQEDANLAAVFPGEEGFVGRPLDLVLVIQQQPGGDQLGAVQGGQGGQGADAFGALGGDAAVQQLLRGVEGVAVCSVVVGVVVATEGGRQCGHRQEDRRGYAGSQNAHSRPLLSPSD